MELSLDLLQPKERASLGCGPLYEAAGCRKYHMGQFEEYALYQENQSFLPSRQVITFTDLDGRLLALKPDVTLSIAKSAQPAPGETKRFYYSENVYRPAAESHTFKEIAQMGVEFIGRAGEAETGQAVALAARSLAWLSESMGPAWRLEVGHMGYLSGLMEALAVPALARQEILARLRARNSHGLRAAALAAGPERGRGGGPGRPADFLRAGARGAAPCGRPPAERRHAGRRGRAAGGAGRGRPGRPDRPVPFGGRWSITTAWSCRDTCRARPGRCCGAAATTCWPASSPPGRGRWGSPSIWTSWTAWPRRPRRRPPPPC